MPITPDHSRDPVDDSEWYLATQDKPTRPTVIEGTTAKPTVNKASYVAKLTSAATVAKPAAAMPSLPPIVLLAAAAAVAKPPLVAKPLAVHKPTTAKTVTAPICHTSYSIAESGPRERYLKVLYYGSPGVGKTRAAGLATRIEALHPVVFVDTEGGALTITREDVVLVQDALTIAKVMDVLRDVRSGALDAKLLVVDTLTALYREQLQIQQTEISINRWVEGVPAQQDYLVGHSRIRVLLSALKKARAHVICCAHSRAFVNAAGLESRRPDLPGVLSEEVCGYFDVVGYLYTKAMKNSVRYLAQFQPFGRVYAKERNPWGDTPRLGPVIDVTGLNLTDIVYQGVILGVSATDTIAATLSKDDEISGEAVVARQE